MAIEAPGNAGGNGTGAKSELHRPASLLSAGKRAYLALASKRYPTQTLGTLRMGISRPSETLISDVQTDSPPISAKTPLR